MSHALPLNLRLILGAACFVCLLNFVGPHITHLGNNSEPTVTIGLSQPWLVVHPQYVDDTRSVRALKWNFRSSSFISGISAAAIAATLLLSRRNVRLQVIANSARSSAVAITDWNESTLVWISITLSLVSAVLGLMALVTSAPWLGLALAFSFIFAGLATLMALPVRRLAAGKRALIIAALEIFLWPLVAVAVWHTRATAVAKANARVADLARSHSATSQVPHVSTAALDLFNPANTYQQFDQTPGKGWRALADDGKHQEAAREIEAYLNRFSELAESQRVNLHFHAAQCLAIAGDAKSVLDALGHLKQARYASEPPDALLRWNDYVEATEAFLKSDLATLKAARERIAAGPKLDGTAANLDVVDRLIANFGKPYAEAYREKDESKPPSMPVIADPLPAIELKIAHQQLEKVLSQLQETEVALALLRSEKDDSAPEVMKLRSKLTVLEDQATQLRARIRHSTPKP